MHVHLNLVCFANHPDSLAPYEERRVITLLEGLFLFRPFNSHFKDANFIPNTHQ